MWFETLLKSVQAGCTTNVSRKCVPGAWTSVRECTITHPRPCPRDVKGEAVSSRKHMWFETLLKSVQAGCTTNVSRKCVPGARTSDWYRIFMTIVITLVFFYKEVPMVKFCKSSGSGFALAEVCALRVFVLNVCLGWDTFPRTISRSHT